MSLGLDEPNPVMRAVGIFFGALFGCAGGFVGELLVTGLTDTMMDALPHLRGPSSIAFYLAASLVPIAIFASVIRSRRADASARAMAIAAFVVLSVLIAGELTGLLVIDRRHIAFYLVPAAP